MHTFICGSTVVKHLEETESFFPRLCSKCRNVARLVLCLLLILFMVVEILPLSALFH